jgi:AbrB family looped-hinge helix DNA binding protein
MSVKVNAKYRITLPQVVREKLKIKAGDYLLVDVQDGIMVLTPEPKRYANSLRGLHGEIWEGIDVRKYLDDERRAWTNSASN